MTLNFPRIVGIWWENLKEPPEHSLSKKQWMASVLTLKLWKVKDGGSCITKFKFGWRLWRRGVRNMVDHWRESISESVIEMAKKVGKFDTLVMFFTIIACFLEIILAVEDVLFISYLLTISYVPETWLPTGEMLICCELRTSDTVISIIREPRQSHLPPIPLSARLKSPVMWNH